MTVRFSQAVDSVAGVFPELRGDCLHWILHLINTIFQAIAHLVVGLFQSIFHFFGLEEACASLWDFIRGFAVHLYESIENGCEHLLDVCDDNPTCSRVLEETKDLAEYSIEQFKEHGVFTSLVICIAAIVVLYICWGLSRCVKYIVVGIVRCCGFRQGGITAKTPASLFMANYGGNVPASSSCARYQSMGARGVY